MVHPGHKLQPAALVRSVASPPAPVFPVLPASAETARSRGPRRVELLAVKPIPDSIVLGWSWSLGPPLLGVRGFPAIRIVAFYPPEIVIPGGGRAIQEVYDYACCSPRHPGYQRPGVPVCPHLAPGGRSADTL